MATSIPQTTKNPLSQSWQGLLPAPTEQKDIIPPCQLGKTLADRAETIYHRSKALGTLLQNGYKNPTRLGTSIITTLAGLSRIYHNDWFLGVPITVTGLKEFFNQITSGGNSSLVEILNAIGTDVEILDTLQKGQEERYGKLDHNIALIRDGVTALCRKLDDIKDLNAQGLSALKQNEKEAYDKGMEAKEAYRSALILYNEAKTAMSESKNTYQQCSSAFKQIARLAKNESEIPLSEKVQRLIEVAESASVQSKEGMNQLQDADQKYAAAMQALVNASRLKDEAIESMTRALQKSIDTLAAGIEIAKHDSACLKKIEESKLILQEIKETGDDFMKVLAEMKTEVKKAKELEARKLDPSDVFVGIGTGVLAAPLGVFTAAALGVTATYAWHNGSVISYTTRKVCDLFSKKKTPPQPMREDELIRVTMNDSSSGWWGWLRGRGSNTLGKAEVNLGNMKVIPLSLNFNNPDYPVSKEQVVTLCAEMFTKLQNEQLNKASRAQLADRYLKLIDKLETASHARGEDHASVKGLIKQQQAVYALVKPLIKHCNQIKQAAAPAA